MEVKMAQAEHVDALVLGSGQGGKMLAWHLARSGQGVAVVERRYVGGSCPNIACMPSKNEVWGARIAWLARHAAQFGTMIPGPISTDMAKVRQRKRDMVEREIAGHLAAFRSSGAELVMGSGNFVAPKTLDVRLNDGGTRLLTGAKVSINVGSHAAIPGIPGLAEARPLTHVEALDLDYAPLAPDRAWRRLCRGGNGTGVSPLRQPGNCDRNRAADHQPGGPGHSQGRARHPE
jgi:pyruvate/2-oxoglutarate dehydrogenase complex dihydrolipoamide dehydrogenase (E3) component